MTEHHDRSRAQEDRTARQLGGTRNSGSGNGPWRKGDVRTSRFLIECKTTTKKSYSLRAADLRDAQRQALFENRTMVFDVEMQGASVMIMDREDFLALLEEFGVIGE